MMEWRNWPLEHKKALMVSAAAGAILGLIWGIHNSPAFWNIHSCMSFLCVVYDMSFLNDGSRVCGGDLSPWSGLIEGPAIGAMYGAVVVYIWKLMKA